MDKGLQCFQVALWDPDIKTAPVYDQAIKSIQLAQPVQRLLMPLVFILDIVFRIALVMAP